MKESFELKKQNRKSIKVTIKNGNFYVAAPFYAKQSDILNCINLFKNKYPNYIELLNQTTKPPNYFYLLGKKVTKEEFGLKDLSYKNLEKLFNAYRARFEERVKELCDVTNTNISKLTFSKFRAKWGSMDSARHMKLNKLIFMLSPSLSDYLIIHELIHTKHMNHSKNFWAEVERFLPNYKAQRQSLKQLGYLLSIYN